MHTKQPRPLFAKPHSSEKPPTPARVPTLTPEPPLKDPAVNHPEWYAQFKIEPITFCMENGMEFWRGNIIKYATRAGSKTYDGLTKLDSEIRDLEKVRRYAEMRINQLKGKSVL